MRQKRKVDETELPAMGNQPDDTYAVIGSLENNPVAGDSLVVKRDSSDRDSRNCANQYDDPGIDTEPNLQLIEGWTMGTEYAQPKDATFDYDYVTGGKTGAPSKEKASANYTYPVDAINRKTMELESGNEVKKMKAKQKANKNKAVVKDDVYNKTTDRDSCVSTNVYSTMCNRSTHFKDALNTYNTLSEMVDK